MTLFPAILFFVLFSTCVIAQEERYGEYESGLVGDDTLSVEKSYGGNTGKLPPTYNYEKPYEPNGYNPPKYGRQKASKCQQERHYDTVGYGTYLPPPTVSEDSNWHASICGAGPETYRIERYSYGKKPYGYGNSYNGGTFQNTHNYGKQQYGYGNGGGSLERNSYGSPYNYGNKPYGYGEKPYNYGNGGGSFERISYDGPYDHGKKPYGYGNKPYNYENGGGSLEINNYDSPYDHGKKPYGYGKKPYSYEKNYQGGNKPSLTTDSPDPDPYTTDKAEPEPGTEDGYNSEPENSSKYYNSGKNPNRKGKNSSGKKPYSNGSYTSGKKQYNSGTYYGWRWR